MGKNDARKKYRANSMGPQWWRKLSLPRRGKKETLLAPVDPSAPVSESHLRRVSKRQQRLRKAVEAQRVGRAKHLAIADWDPVRGMAKVVAARGNALSSMGVFIEGVQWLYPEEAVYLVDRAQMDLRVDGVPASLQRVFGFLVEGSTCLTLEEYCAFSHLRRVGYVVRRFGMDVFDEQDTDETESSVKAAPSARSGSPEVVVLNPSFSVWRVGGFKRKETHRPIFHLLVRRYEDPPPRHAELANLLSSCSGKTRIRTALIDRGVVVLVDIANNATPLSTRYTSRLPTPLTVPLSCGPVTDIAPSLARPLPIAANDNGLEESGSLVDVDAENRELTAFDLDLVLAAAKSCGESCAFEDLLAALHSQNAASGICSARGMHGVISPDELLSALRELSRRDFVVLSSGDAPIVYIVREQERNET
jgi:tRNA-splicing endonuclease subunit sen54 N-term